MSELSNGDLFAELDAEYAEIRQATIDYAVGEMAKIDLYIASLEQAKEHLAPHLQKSLTFIYEEIERNRNLRIEFQNGLLEAFGEMDIESLVAAHKESKLD